MKRGKNNNFAVEKPDKLYLSQVTKVSTNSDIANVDKLRTLCDAMKMAFGLVVSFLPKPHNYNLITRKAGKF